MDPLEQKNTHSYPNADRGLSADGTINQNVDRPLVHMSDVMSNHQPKSENTDRTSSVHTFKDDLSKEAASGNFSVAKIAVANSKRLHSEEKAKFELNPKKDNHLLFKILLPIISILIIGVFSYIGYNTAKTPQEISLAKNPTQQIVSNIIYTEQTVEINIKSKSRSAVYMDILKEKENLKTSSSKIKAIIFTSQEGTTSNTVKSNDFLNLIAPTAPDLLVRNLKPEYVFGYFAYQTNEPFIILKSENYDSVFAGMLEWEKNIYGDLGDLMFKDEINLNVKSTTTASTTTATSTENKPIYGSEFNTSFIDKVISNNDTRVLYRPNGKIAFFYTFFNKDTVIITTSEETLHELIYRLTSGKITR